MMDVQLIAAAIIIFAALLYVGAQVWRKAKSFSPKRSSCAADCGCASGSKTTESIVKN